MKTFFLKNYKLILAVSLLLAVILIQNCSKQQLKNKNQLQAVELASIKDTVESFRNKNEELVTKVLSTTVTANNRKKALEEAGFEIDKLKQDNVKWRDVNLALKMKLDAAGSGTITLHDTIPVYIKGDTIQAKVGKWNNDYLFLWPYLVGNKLNFKYTYQTNINLLQEQKGKSYVITAKLSDPNASIMTGNSITIVPKKRWWDKWYVYGAVGVAGGVLLVK